MSGGGNVPEMVERVARAIYETWAKVHGTQTSFEDMVSRADAVGYPAAKKCRNEMFAEARAAIKVMRAPTLIEAADIVEDMATEWPADAERLQQAANRIRCRALRSTGGGDAT